MKVDMVGNGWMAMIAGNAGKARQLVANYRTTLNSEGLTIDHANIHDHLSMAPRLQRRKLVEDYIQSKLSISYETFLSDGKSILPEELHRQILWDVQAITLDCEIVLAGFIGTAPYVFSVWRDGSVSQAEAFVAVGSGATVAQAALFQRGFDGSLDIMEALYYIYEAKRLSEVAPGVGQTTGMFVMLPSRRVGGDSAIFGISLGAFESLNAQYRRFGLKAFKPTIGFGDLIPEDAEGKLIK
ncbi:MAG: hypothetical protein ABJF23_33630 [Bryobacteraceae bacterium]